MVEGVWICFPHAAGNGNYYRDVLPADFSVLGIDYPGHGSRMHEALCTNMDRLLDDVEQMVVNQWEKLEGKRIFFFGHSMGAVVAYEIAKRLEEKQFSIEGLVISSKASPIYDFENQVSYQRNKDEVADLLRDFGGTPAEVLEHEELRELVMEILCADLNTLHSYQTLGVRTKKEVVPLKIPMYLLCGTEDVVSAESMESWAYYTRFPCQILQLQGNHFYFMESKSAFEAILQDILQKTHIEVFV